jgi:NAD(P)-dependent dehydrogenase (short-subunit alcohol dehydrogenase family)
LIEQYGNEGERRGCIVEGYDFSGRVALVTGGSKGIGRATARLLAELGADVGLVARTAEDVRATATVISAETGASCVPLPGDVSDFVAMQKRFQELVARFGRLDILVNSAGINNPKGTRETSVEEWQEVIDVNLTGVFVCCKLGAEIMAEQNTGSIINVSSVQSRIGGRSPQYSASKAGVEGLTKSLAREMAKFSVRVNAVAPGGTETDFAKQYWSEGTREMLCKQALVGRVAEPEEVARVIVFIASPDASYITGSTIHVNGGLFLN